MAKRSIFFAENVMPEFQLVGMVQVQGNEHGSQHRVQPLPLFLLPGLLRLLVVLRLAHGGLDHDGGDQVHQRDGH